MATQPRITILEAATGEVIERPMTAGEVAGLELAITEQEGLIAEREAKSLARKSALAKLAALGLTEAEIAAL